MKFLYLYTDHFQNYDFLLALRQTEHSIDAFDTPFMTYEPDEALLAQLDSLLVTNSYDAVINFGYVPYISNLCNNHNIPYISWTYDSILHSLYNDSIENSCNVLFVYDKDEYSYLKEHFTIPNLFHLPLAANVERIQAIRANDDAIRHYSYDVSFVGDLYQHNTYVDLEPILSPEERAYFEQAFSYFHGVWGDDSIYDWFSKADADYLQQRLPAHLKNDERMPNQRYFADILLSKPIACRERIDMLNRLAKKHSVRLYHKNSTDISVLHNVDCHPGVNYYDAMSVAFKHSKINLNITLHGMRTGIPLRCFDIMAAGGFLITNYQSDFDELFTENKDCVIYRNLSELEDKVTYYLQHDIERKHIAINGFDTICKHHTYQQRVSSILAIITNL